MKGRNILRQLRITRSEGIEDRIRKNMNNKRWRNIMLASPINNNFIQQLDTDFYNLDFSKRDKVVRQQHLNYNDINSIS